MQKPIHLHHRSSLHDAAVMPAMQCVDPLCKDEADPDAPVALCAAHVWRVFAYALPVAEQRAERELVARQVPDRAPNAPGILRGAQGWVYFIRRGDLVKIGWTSEPKQRFIQLQPDDILLVKPGRLTEEKQCHAAFAHLR